MTNHVRDRLPFWAGHDLSDSEQALVDAHLAECSECRAEAERLRAAMAWLQEAQAPPFDESDHRALRASILARLPQEPAPRTRLRLRIRPLWIAAATAAVLLLALRSRVPGSTPAPHPPSARTEPRATRPRAAPAPAFPRLAASHPLQTPIPVPPRRPRPAPPPQLARLEFQTSDPSIRIIWLAQATPSSNPNPVLPEAP